MVQRVCIIESCMEVKAKWGMCSIHAELWSALVRNEKMTKLFGWSDEDRFNYYLVKNPSSEVQETFGAKSDCWIWKGALSDNAYGLFKPSGGKSQHTHLFALSEIAGVQLFPEEETDHLCRFRPCTNPSHLERVTHRTNTLRGVGPSAENARKQYCVKNHEFTRENTRFDSNGGRSCVACQKDYTAREKYKEARREKYIPSTGVRGKGQYQLEREKCSEGHLLTEENVMIEKVKKVDSIREVRRCRACRLQNQRDRYAASQEDEVAPGILKSDCVTRNQAAEMMGITPTYAPTFLKRNPGFPEPVRVGRPSYYLKADVETWITVNAETLAKVKK